ncbi:hypothetical protein Ae168Ps1_4300c [Pseudonocardia sp. Ae168_Ps1]|nr:hypothetical protein Ae150APs1_4274c [Pseudonocardia sp. Ae150A_Ps1]OLL81894.1 hypothetical protein Ae168Ps1_4300c [Pseudonocardia sp. Ae168_Ps1]OLL83993.1 hypothetical protein Ae263Ps1_1048 [Pseudonocardia sp. Ae263_Ps1]OLL95987.1 hypothetical protein Ae356Ps1_5884c [Pseudonocardia sp. Ae356_Ps1]
MVNEIIVAFLGTLHLDRRSESKPFTPWSGRDPPAVRPGLPARTPSITPGATGIIPVPDVSRLRQSAETS